MNRRRNRLSAASLCWLDLYGARCARTLCRHVRDSQGSSRLLSTGATGVPPKVGGQADGFSVSFIPHACIGASVVRSCLQGLAQTREAAHAEAVTIFIDVDDERQVIGIRRAQFCKLDTVILLYIASTLLQQLPCAWLAGHFADDDKC